MSFNPFAEITGVFLKIKLAYLACLIEVYGDTELLDELHGSRHETPTKRNGKDIMNNYKSLNKQYNQGDIAIAKNLARRFDIP